MDVWFKKSKQILIELEEESIKSRLAAWTNIVSQCTDTTYFEIFNKPFDFSKFVINVTNSEKNIFLSLVHEWKGLKLHLVEKSGDLTYEQYLFKSKNWLSGNRATHYAKTLYPFMIKSAENYIHNITNQILLYNDDEKREKELMVNICMYSYLKELCSIKIRASKKSRKTFLLCDNSISRCHVKQNETCHLLQKYAQNHQYVHQFPLYRQDAIDYFRKQKQNDLQILLSLLKRKSDKISIKEYIDSCQDIKTLMTFIGNHCKTDDGDRVIIGNETFNIITGIMQQIHHQTVVNQEKMNEVHVKMQNMETNLQLLSMWARLNK